nr:retrovirus-related Pol polyprotein from transposon TNT 1-94 [Tanacetum cinerariifolium]
DNFELKHGLLTLVQNKQFYGLDKEDTHAHIHYFNKITSTLKFPDVLNTSIKLLLFPFSLEGAARIWLEKEPPQSILNWDDLISKFINQFFPPSKTTSLRNEITNFQQRFDETLSEACDRFKNLLRACPHHGFLELRHLDTFYNALNSKDQDSLNSAAGGNFLDKIPCDYLSIIERKSKVCYSRDKPVVARAPAYQAPAPQTQGVLKEDFSAYVKANDAVMKNMQTQEIVLFIVDSGCSKYMIGNLKLLINFVENFLGTVKFVNDQIAPILGYGDLVQGAVTIKRVYYVEGLNHNLISVSQFCDADLEVAFRKSTCYIRDLKGNNLLTGSRGTDLYSIKLQDTNSPNLICLMAKATSSQAWLWHHRLSHLNFNTINLLSKNDILVGLPKLKFIKDHLCSFYELGKAKRKSFHTKLTSSSKRRLQLLHMDLCGPMRVASINGKRYVLVIVDDYSRYTWTYFLRSKDETPEVLIDFLRLVQRGL